MDRIAALRNVEDALADFEAGETSLSALEAEVRGVLRTYATDFDGDLVPYEASGGAVDGDVVLASSTEAARDRFADLVDEPGDFEVAPVE